MDFIVKAFSFLASNYELILTAIVSILLALGAIAESLNLVFGKGEESALSKVGKALVKAGNVVKKFIDLIKPKAKSEPENKPE